MMMSDLPSELVEEILSRVPAADLKRLRSTCKRWNSLFKEPRFTEKHFHKAPKQPRVLILKDYKIFPMSIDFDAAPPSVEFKSPLGLPDSHSNAEKVYIGEFIQCDGLLLCITFDKIAVSNPWLGEARWIQSKYGYKDGSQFGIGYENKKSFRSYKILRFGSCWDKNQKHLLEFEIYDSWRVLDDVSLDSNTQLWEVGVVSLKGNSYGLESTSGNHAALSAVRDEKLSVLHWDNDIYQMTVWVTDRIETEAATLSWSKAFKVDFDWRISYPYFKSFLYDEEKKTALCCESCDMGYVTNMTKLYIIREHDEYNSETPYVGYTDKPYWPYVLDYVPSLVHIPAKVETQEENETRN
ncbi:unnamed protein product [Microthlaspi erraticum]|uniref:F-box domain-containing protein n=2 Tax=Brassicaceae TaxID=3700 RepID=A0A6D2HI68_9BRAS|nr:unnamed protein product [Microthlaspi erraticum]